MTKLVVRTPTYFQAPAQPCPHFHSRIFFFSSRSKQDGWPARERVTSMFPMATQATCPPCSAWAANAATSDHLSGTVQPSQKKKKKKKKSDNTGSSLYQWASQTKSPDFPTVDASTQCVDTRWNDWHFKVIPVLDELASLKVNMKSTLRGPSSGTTCVITPPLWSLVHQRKHLLKKLC